MFLGCKCIFSITIKRQLSIENTGFATWQFAGVILDPEFREDGLFF